MLEIFSRFSISYLYIHEQVIKKTRDFNCVTSSANCISMDCAHEESNSTANFRVA